jgi:hypothetical protein
MALEHCIAPFLDSCDEDNNHRITLKEWGICLKLGEVRNILQCHLAVCEMMMMMMMMKYCV